MPEQPPSGVVPLDYSPQRARNRLARRSVILALIPVPFVTGILAIRAAKRSEAESYEPRIAFFGRTFGWINLVLSTLASLIVPPYLVHRYHLAAIAECQVQLRDIGQTALLYANEHRGEFPDSLATLNEYAKAESIPIAKHDALVWVRLPSWAHSLQNSVPAYGVQAYEPIENHSDGSNFLFVDGHVEFVPKNNAERVIADVLAGHNPPNEDLFK